MNSIHSDSSRQDQATRGETFESSTVTADQLARLSRISEADLQGLIDYGVLAPAVSASEHEMFASDCIAVLLRAGRLRSELALDSHAFALSVMLLTQIIGLETEVRELRGELSTIGVAPLSRTVRDLILK